MAAVTAQRTGADAEAAVHRPWPALPSPATRTRRPGPDPRDDPRGAPAWIRHLTSPAPLARAAAAPAAPAARRARCRRWQHRRLPAAGCPGRPRSPPCAVPPGGRRGGGGPGRACRASSLRPGRGPRAARRRAGRGQTLLVKRWPAPSTSSSSGCSSPRPHAVRRHGPGDLRGGESNFRFRRVRCSPTCSRRRDQPHAAQDLASLLESMEERQVTVGQRLPCPSRSSWSPPRTRWSTGAPTRCPRRSSTASLPQAAGRLPDRYAGAGGAGPPRPGPRPHDLAATGPHRGGVASAEAARAEVKAVRVRSRCWLHALPGRPGESGRRPPSACRPRRRRRPAARARPGRGWLAGRSSPPTR